MTTEVSTKVSNSTTLPRVINDSHRGRLISVADTAEIANGADADRMILAVRVPAHAKIRSVRLASDDLVGDATLSVGFFFQDNAPNGTTFTAIDVDIIANEVDANDAALALTELRFSALDINTVNQQAWELAGLSAKPAYADLFIGLTAETDTEAAGTVTLIVDFIA